MSTKKIREALERLRNGNPESLAIAEDALEDLAAIERAATVLVAEDVPGMVYKVRDRAATDASFTGNTWEHPRVVAFGEAAEVLESIAKEGGK